MPFERAGKISDHVKAELITDDRGASTANDDYRVVAFKDNVVRIQWIERDGRIYAETVHVAPTSDGA
jgi:hypothetical protein